MRDATLVIRNLRRRFGGVTALDGLNLHVNEGDLRCIIGPNGAGKSTFFNILCGVDRPDAGSIRFLGREIVGMATHEFARSGIARKFQIPSVFESMSVGDNLDIPVREGWRQAERQEKIARVLRQTRLVDQADLPASSLSHGQKQWLEIGMAMMTEPKLLLLDEPTAGMTQDETEATVALLLGLKQETTILVIEHDMLFVRNLNQPTMVMHQGRVICEGPFAAVEQNELVRDVYLGSTL